MNMKHRLMIACLCSLPVGFSILSARLTGAATFQSQQSTNQSEDVRTLSPGAGVARRANRDVKKLALVSAILLRGVRHPGRMEVAIFPRQYFFPPRKFRDTFSLPAPVEGEGADPNSWPVFVSE
jgi:hypothetical protein